MVTGSILEMLQTQNIVPIAIMQKFEFMSMNKNQKIYSILIKYPTKMEHISLKLHMFAKFVVKQLL